MGLHYSGESQERFDSLGSALSAELEARRLHTLSPGDLRQYPNHMDVTYTADTNGVSVNQSVGYKLDGIEGYIYPKARTQPTGTVRLMRKYNPTRDDYGLFPEDEYGTYYNDGYTVSVGNDWIGYVCSNSGTPSGVCL